MCKNSLSEQSVEQYYNTGHEKPHLLTNVDPGVGLDNSKLNVENGYLICSFRRAKKNSETINYCNLNNPYFILAAYGPFILGT